MTSGQDLVNRFREEIIRSLEPRIDALVTEIREQQIRFSRTLEDVEQRLQEFRQLDLATAAGLISEEVEGASRHEAEDLSFLARYASELRRLETQEEILNAMLDAAFRFVPRVALLTVRGDHVAGWATRGYDSDSATGMGSYESSSQNALFRQVLASDGCVTTDDLSEVPGLVELLPAGAPGRTHFLPMRTLGRPVAVVVAAPAANQAGDAEVLGLLVSITALRIENLALRILKELELPAATGGEPAPAVPPVPFRVEPGFGEPEPVAEAACVPHEAVASPPEVPTAEAVAPVTSTPADEQAVTPWEATEPVPAPVQASGLSEQAPGPEAAQPVIDVFPVDHEPEPAAAEPAFPVEPVLEAEIQAPEPVKAVVAEEAPRFVEEEKLHAEAKRFARLLVSELKLYNEQRVAEGRQNRDIYVRLKRDIDRSREMYQKRVSPQVSRKIDYFHDELIRILGDNDSSALGSDYPGPLVEQ